MLRNVFTWLVLAQNDTQISFLTKLSIFNCSLAGAIPTCFTSCSFLSLKKQGFPKDNSPRTLSKNKVTRLLTELSMFEKVTVTDAMAEDIEKLRPRLKKVHIRELVLAMAIMPKTQKPIFTCRRKYHCSYNHHGQKLERLGDLLESPTKNMQTLLTENDAVGRG